MEVPGGLSVSASVVGWGACILQGSRPVEYASRTMTRREHETYAQIEKRTVCCYLYNGDISNICINIY